MHMQSKIYSNHHDKYQSGTGVRKYKQSKRNAYKISQNKYGG